MKYTKGTLRKLEETIAATGFNVRYEKGHFTAGYCLLEKKKIVLVNKFFDLEAKINSLIEILKKLYDQDFVHKDVLKQASTFIKIENGV